MLLITTIGVTSILMACFEDKGKITINTDLLNILLILASGGICYWALEKMKTLTLLTI